MANDADETATPAIWDKRYQQGTLACTQQTVDADPIDYTQHPFLFKQSTAKQLTGDTEGTPLRTVAERYLKPAAANVLAVGSGLAFAEEWLVTSGYAERIIAFESSAIAVDSARERIRALGLQDRIEMRCGNVVDAGFHSGEFDAVFVQAAIHHFFNIEEMFAFFHHVLKPDGLILYDEYVGPDHHMYESEVMCILDEMNDCMAPTYRWDVLRQNTRVEVPRATLDWMMQMDPSEGVHSSMILPLTYKYFNVEFRRDYGGTILRPFFVGILPNFDWNDVKDQTIAKQIVLMENLLVRHGVIPSYHTRVVGKRRNIPRTDLTVEERNRINYANWSGFETFGPQTVIPEVVAFCAANHSDFNWKNGVGVFEEAVLFLARTGRTDRNFLIGKRAVFVSGESRIIIDLKEIGESLIVTFSGGRLNPDIAGYPNTFKLCE